MKNNQLMLDNQGKLESFQVSESFWKASQMNLCEVKCGCLFCLALTEEDKQWNLLAPI